MCISFCCCLRMRHTTICVPFMRKSAPRQEYRQVYKRRTNFGEKPNPKCHKSIAAMCCVFVRVCPFYVIHTKMLIRIVNERSSQHQRNIDSVNSVHGWGRENERFCCCCCCSCLLLGTTKALAVLIIIKLFSFIHLQDCAWVYLFSGFSFKFMFGCLKVRLRFGKFSACSILLF